ncbi:MAG: hypothetical protein H6735_06380 [Alphaproteobacteria bacterium]|nr:hypothetical protein [Alphaproteobacteria bacterium]
MLDEALEALGAWSAGQEHVEARLGPPLTDAAIDAAFAAIQPHHGTFAFRPAGEYRAFLRRHDGLAIAYRGGSPLDDVAFRVFDVATIVRVQRDHVFLRTPDLPVGVGRAARTIRAGRNHLLAFAGGKHAPDVLHVFDTRADPADHIHTLDVDAAAYGESTLLVDEHGAWLPPAPTPRGQTFVAWLGEFVETVRGTDFSDW